MQIKNYLNLVGIMQPLPSSIRGGKFNPFVSSAFRFVREVIPTLLPQHGFIMGQYGRTGSLF